MQLNLNVKNQRFEEVTNYIQNVNADAVLIAELTPQWQQHLSTHLTNYPHAIAVPRIDTYGIGVYSKSPLRGGTVEYFGKSGHPSVIAEVSGLEKPISLLHTHVQGPVKKPFFVWHKEQFELMLARVKTMPMPLVMSGDMNSNAWTYLISDFLREAELDDTQWGRGIQLTWPTPFYWRYGVCPLLTIDHFFASKDIMVTQRKLGRPIGSDHYPVIIELSIKRYNPKALEGDRRL
jgi:endonuclease/exonuclease/phosphatase (EEP) superfamily protein YafD